jgi:flagellin-like hook-associated protein FlgL
LSAGERSNLLALQSTADLTSTVQQRLATGKRVNSALDNPQNYFTARSLDSRVGDLNNLLDGMRQAEQSLAEAGNGISALIKLVQSAKSIAAEAKQAPQPATGFYSSAFTVGTTALTAPAATVITGTTDMTAATADMYGMVINVGGVAYSVAMTNQYKTGAQIVADINNTPGLGSGGAATASLDGSGHLVLSSNSAAAVSVDLNDGAMSTGLFNPDLLTANPALDGTTLNVQAQNSPAATVQFGTGAGQVHDLSGLYQAAHPAGVMPWLWSQKLGFYDAQMPWPNQGSLTISGSAVAPPGMTSGTYSYGPVGSSDPTRAALAQQYNAILDQIAALSGDSSYAGTNLLAGGDLPVALNESGAALTIKAVDDSLGGLGLTPTPNGGFQTNADVDAYVSRLDTVLNALRSQAASFGSSLATLQVRQDFTKNMISTLQNGADNLTLADSNAESANLLALQTRGQLSTTALTLATQSDQSVLRLFG